MRDAGVAVDRVAGGEKLLDPANVAAWLELHIEQGPVLVARKLPVAIVTGIRGNFRHRTIECLGEAGHSGAIPRWLRHDAVFATAELITRLDRHWRTLLERGRDLVMTTGIIGTDPAEHALARIPGRLRFSFEARSQSTETLEAFYDLFLLRMRRHRRGTRRAVSSSTAGWIRRPHGWMTAWIARLRAILRAMELPDEPIPSGAGHDAAVFANAGIPSAMIFVRNEHGSHNPKEAMAMDDFLLGAELLRPRPARRGRTRMTTAPDDPTRDAAAAGDAATGATPPRHPGESGDPGSLGHRLRGHDEETRHAAPEDLGAATARLLLTAGAIAFSREHPFILAAGWASPVYVDCRRLIGEPAVRHAMTDLAVGEAAAHVRDAIAVRRDRRRRDCRHPLGLLAGRPVGPAAALRAQARPGDRAERAGGRRPGGRACACCWSTT